MFVVFACLFFLHSPGSSDKTAPDQELRIHVKKFGNFNDKHNADQKQTADTKVLFLLATLRQDPGIPPKEDSRFIKI